jgi:hypothetical protein
MPILSLGLAALLLSPPAAAENWGEFTREELFATYFPEAPEAPAVVLLDEGIVRVDARLRLRLQRHRRVKIFDEAGLSQAEYRIPYCEGQEIRELRSSPPIGGSKSTASTCATR